MAAAIDQSLLRDHSPWSQRAYAILDSMSARGNLSARLIRFELKQLDDELAQLLMKGGISKGPLANTLHGPRNGSNSEGIASLDASGEQSHSLGLDFAESFGQHYELSPDQLMELANSLDLESLAWPLTSMDDLPDPGT